MSTPELPDDPRHWPDDPYTLLGVRPGADDADIKRAYTRLIRRFKPEHYPEQFRRIREAYEACLSHSSWYFPYESREVGPTVPPDEAALPRPAPVADEAGRLWNEAIAGREAEAYAELSRMADAQPERDDIALRLYWLLALNPQLDEARTRHDWLASALTRSRLRGPAAELYRRELESNAVVLYDPYKDLLDTAAEPSDLLAIARWRMTAAGRTSRYYLLADDLRKIRDRLIRWDESSWFGLLMMAANWAAFAPEGDLPELCRDELATLRHLELSHSHLFDRLEESAHVAETGRTAEFQHLPEKLVELVRTAWCTYGEVWPADVEPAIAAVAADPVLNLERFDWLFQVCGPGFGMLFLRALERYRDLHGAVDESPFSHDLIRGLARQLAGTVRWEQYSLVRSELLLLLIDQAIDPLEFAAACEVDLEYGYRMMTDPLRCDLGLQVVWLAARLHYG